MFYNVCFILLFLRSLITHTVCPRCIINCGPKVNPSVKLSIEAVCQGLQCTNIKSYQWVLYKKESNRPSDLELIATTPLYSRVMVIKKNSLGAGENYTLVVVVRAADGLKGMSLYAISTSSPPTNGNCSVEPASGISLVTNFTLKCNDWASENGPLSYQFQVNLHNGLTNFIYQGSNNSVISFLPSGVSSENYTLNVTFTVTDMDGASAPAVIFPVQVSFYL